MRKLFSILSAVLVSLAMQATVITKNYDLSGASAYGTATVSGGSITGAAKWNGLQAWTWTEGALEYDQIVLEVADHDHTILLKVTYSGTPDIEEQIEMPASKNSVALDIKHNIVKGIQVLNWSETSGVNITITGLYMRGATGIKKNVTIWSGTKTFEEFDWNNRLLMSAENFADLHVGDILEVYYTTDAQSYHQFDVKTNYDNAYPAFAPAQISLGGSNESGVLRFYIAESSDLSNIASKEGLYLNGKYITFTKVSVIKHELLWSGDQTIGNWDQSITVEASKLSELVVGDVLCFHINNYTAGGLIYLKYGEWIDFSPKKEYKFADTGSEEKTVEILVTTSMLNQLNGKNLIVQGAQYSINEIYVKKGTGPAATVNKEIEVTSAGMATLVLPFAVPSLPDGVEAYTLTNNGDKDIIATEVYSLNTDEPVLIKAPQGNYTFVSEEGASEDISSKTGLYRNGALVGTYYKINDVSAISTDADANYKYLLQNGSEGVGFYQVRDNSCYVDPYRAYLSCGYDATTSVDAPARAMRIVFRENTATGVDNIESATFGGSQKILRNGQLFILRNGVEYNANGALVK